MTDRRMYRSNGRVAHRSVLDVAAGIRVTDGELQSVTAPVADVRASPGGALDRQLLCGDVFCVLEDEGGWCFGFARPSGYVGYVARGDLGPVTKPTHRVVTLGGHVYPEQSIKVPPLRLLPFGARIAAGDLAEGFLAVGDGFMPDQQLVPLTQPEPDPAATALRFLGVPYLWGGDSSFGVDCSGLVHIALTLAGVACPRDSDQQARAFAAVPDGAPLQRNDLVFWKGHVALMLDPETIVHANGHHMATTVEPLAEVAQRILDAEDKPISKRARPLVQHL